jgi:processive 1,2-diacylglycerol beta-glucosyltransferase
MVLSEWLLVGVASTFAAAGGVAQRQQRLRHLQRVTRSLSFPDGAPRVLILSASIGGGHNAAAAVLRHDLERLGSHACILDGFALATPLLSRYFAWAYPLQLRYTPWLYELQFRSSHLRTWTRMWRRIYAGLGGVAFRRLIEELHPDVVVSTYPLVTQALGVLRSTGRLLTPVAATVTDYGVHRLWIAPGVDLHLVPSRVSAEQVEDATGEVRVMQPLVREAFRQSRNRAAVRQRYGFAADDFVALVVAGAWGIGHVELIVRDVVECGVRVVVVCGKNQELAEQLRREYAGRPTVQVLGLDGPVARAHDGSRLPDPECWWIDVSGGHRLWLTGVDVPTDRWSWRFQRCCHGASRCGALDPERGRVAYGPARCCGWTDPVAGAENR